MHRVIASYNLNIQFNNFLKRLSESGIWRKGFRWVQISINKNYFSYLFCSLIRLLHLHLQHQIKYFFLILLQKSSAAWFLWMFRLSFYLFSSYFCFSSLVLYMEKLITPYRNYWGWNKNFRDPNRDRMYLLPRAQEVLLPILCLTCVAANKK